MTTEKAMWRKSRKVLERIYITGRLILDTPTHFGNGDAVGTTDINLLRDVVDGKRPLLPGASIAGALRNYIREYELGYGEETGKDGETAVEQLFGYLHDEQSASFESALIVDDALGNLPSENPIEIRDGVAIDPKTRTALIDGKGKGYKYDTELLSAGTTFRLSFEFLLTAENKKHLPLLVAGLRAFEHGDIHMGLRKRRGFGRCHVTGWQVQQYKMNNAAQVAGWLNHTISNELNDEDTYKPNIAELLDVPVERQHNGEAFTLDAIFQLRNSLLIRSDSGDGADANMVHLRNAAGDPILSGTSLAGALRGRALRIANTVLEGKTAVALIDSIFGKRIENSNDNPTGSPLIVEESVIKNGIDDRIQNRVKIDRFTGGAYPQALFSQQPIFARDETPTTVQIKFTLRKTPVNRDESANEAENKPARIGSFNASIGLLLLVLKDLWTEDLPLGGESSVGRGRLRGQTATLHLGDDKWVIEDGENGRLSLPANSQQLESFVQALQEWKGDS